MTGAADPARSGVGRRGIADNVAGRISRPYQRIPGVQAAVLFDGDVVLSTAHGYADVERGVAADDPTTCSAWPRTPRRSPRRQSCSSSRPARWRSTTPSASGCPVSSPPVSDVTLREMLAHSERDLPRRPRQRLLAAHATLSRTRRAAARSPLSGAECSRRNERFKYSNITFSLLGLVIRAASGSGVQRLRHRQHRRAARAAPTPVPSSTRPARASTPSGTAR